MDIQTYADVVDAAFCQSVIAGFEAHQAKIPSHVYNKSRPEIRSGSVVLLKDIERGEDLKEVYTGACFRCLEMFRTVHPGLDSITSTDFQWTEPRIERVAPGGGFLWHMDSRQMGNDRRFLTVILYLNDVVEGGELEFLLQSIKIAPRRGLMVAFPPYWTHTHRGNPPAETKYAIGSFGFVTAQGDDGRYSPEQTSIR